MRQGGHQVKQRLGVQLVSVTGQNCQQGVTRSAHVREPGEARPLGVQKLCFQTRNGSASSLEKGVGW